MPAYVPSGFPIGAALGGSRWRVTEVLRGGPDRGQLRAAGYPVGLVTIATPQKGDRASFVASLDWTSPGIAPLLWSGSVAADSATYDVLVEAEPRGRSLDVWQGTPAAARAIARALVETVREAQDRAVVMGGLRPELVYVAGDELSGIAPRADRFLANASEPCYGVPPCFDDIYVAPEQLALRPPGPPADIFALGAVLARLFTGRAPFGGASMLDRMSAALYGRHAPLDAAGSLAPVLAAAMSVEPADRPSIEDIGRALA